MNDMLMRRVGSYQKRIKNYVEDNVRSGFEQLDVLDLDLDYTLLQDEPIEFYESVIEVLHNKRVTNALIFVKALDNQTLFINSNIIVLVDRNHGGKDSFSFELTKEPHALLKYFTTDDTQTGRTFVFDTQHSLAYEKIGHAYNEIGVFSNVNQRRDLRQSIEDILDNQIQPVETYKSELHTLEENESQFNQNDYAHNTRPQTNERVTQSENTNQEESAADFIARSLRQS